MPNGSATFGIQRGYRQRAHRSGRASFEDLEFSTIQERLVALDSAPQTLLKVRVEPATIELIIDNSPNDLGHGLIRDQGHCLEHFRMISCASNRHRLCWLKPRSRGFEAKLTSSKWATIAKRSLDTALRKIMQLRGSGAQKKSSGGEPQYRLRAEFSVKGLFGTRWCRRNVLVLHARVNQELGDLGGHHGKGADADTHRDDAHQPSSCRDREHVAIADGRDRRARPPQCIEERVEPPVLANVLDECEGDG